MSSSAKWRWISFAVLLFVLSPIILICVALVVFKLPLTIEPSNDEYFIEQISNTMAAVEIALGPEWAKSGKAARLCHPITTTPCPLGVRVDDGPNNKALSVCMECSGECLIFKNAINHALKAQPITIRPNLPPKISSNALTLFDVRVGEGSLVSGNSRWRFRGFEHLSHPEEAICISFGKEKTT